MLTISRSLSRPYFSLFKQLKASFCELKTNPDHDPNPVQKQVSSPQSQAQEAQRSRRSYIQQYEARTKNVHSYKITLDSLLEEREKIEEARKQANSPLQKFIDWLFDKKSHEQKVIQQLRTSIQNSQNFGSDAIKETLAQKQFLNHYRHRDFGQNLIKVSNSLNKVELSQGKNDKIKQGVDLTVRMLNMILNKYGFTPFKPMPKEKFNKTLHQEVDRIRTQQPKDTIVKVVEDGWMYKEEVLIHAKVIVSE